VIVSGITLTIGGGVVVFLARLPSVGDAETRVQRQLAENGVTDRGEPVPGRIALAMIAVEDSNFRANPGIDAQGVIRGVLGAISGGGDPGGSTITQQLAKALYPNVTKLDQVGLAVKLNERYGKDRILEMYASVEYLGHGAYGIDNAAQTYFHRSALALDWAEASMLAALLQAPSRLDPTAHFDDARGRQRHVLDRLVVTGALTGPQADQAFAELSSLDR